MATTTGETTVSFKTEDGETEPVPLSEFEDRAGEAIDRLRRHRQLSFSVGGREPDAASLKLSGELGLHDELRKGQKVIVTVADEAGEVLAASDGYVASVSFKDEYKDGFIVGTMRSHAVKLV